MKIINKINKEENNHINKNSKEFNLNENIVIEQHKDNIDSLCNYKEDEKIILNINLPSTNTKNCENIEQIDKIILSLCITNNFFI